MSKVWLITGSATGLGRAIAQAALERGDTVVLTARDTSGLADLVQAFPDTASALTLDITDAAQARRAVEDTVASYGRLDVLVNNAGQGLVGALEELTDQEMRQSVEVNFFGPLNMIRAALPSFRAQKSGHIINISAIAAVWNEMGFSVYGGAKAGLDAACEGLASELRPLGIRITLVQPGPFRTEFISRSVRKATGRIGAYDPTSGAFSALLDRISGKQPGDPAKAAGAVLAVADSETPPFRLPLGKYAYDKYRKKLKAVEQELAAWESTGLPTDRT